MRGVPRWFAVLCVVAFGVAMCAFSLRHALASGSSRLQPASTAALPVASSSITDATDSFGDGTPDFLRLADSADRRAFRGWFTLLAESQYYKPRLPAEIDDCAALLRFSYREALRQHDSAWLSAMSLPALPRSGEVHQYHYPRTPLGAAIFRVQNGSFAAGDVSDGAFAEFADAKTLWRDDTHSVGRDLTRARPGDLLFFRQTEGHTTYHAMIFLGASQIEPGPGRYLIYHTGPQGNDPGEIRRLTVAELTNFPDARWRPVTSNPAFLGIYRWNILRGDP
jgi:uncharacterized protein